MKVLYEDNHLLVVNKPTEMATMGAQPGRPSVYDWAVEYIRKRYDKPGNVYVGIVSRLDAMTSGVLVLARTSKAASRLAIQFGGPGKHKKISEPAKKLYLAIVDGNPETESDFPRSGMLSDLLFKDDKAQRMRVDSGNRKDAKEATLRYVVVESRQNQTLLAIRLLTGRKHQIRVQMAERGHPILGDKKYGSRRSFPAGIALHSWQLFMTHPTTTQALRFVAPVPDCWNTANADTAPVKAFSTFSRTDAIESLCRDQLDWPDDPSKPSTAAND